MRCSRCDQHFIWGTIGRNKLKNFLPLLTNNSQDFMELESVEEELYKLTNIGLPLNIHFPIKTRDHDELYH